MKFKKDGKNYEIRDVEIAGDDKVQVFEDGEEILSFSSHKGEDAEVFLERVINVTNQKLRGQSEGGNKKARVTESIKTGLQFANGEVRRV